VAAVAPATSVSAISVSAAPVAVAGPAAADANSVAAADMNPGATAADANSVAAADMDPTSSAMASAASMAVATPLGVCRASVKRGHDDRHRGNAKLSPWTDSHNRLLVQLERWKENAPSSYSAISLPMQY
jgi:hypothetical protein